MIRHNTITLPDLRAADIPKPLHTTDVKPVHLSEELTIEVAVTTPTETTDTPDKITFQAWSGFVSRDDVRNGQLLSLGNGLGGRVIAPNNLGIGDDTSRIPKHMRSDLQHGDFSELAMKQWEAMRAAAPDLSTDLDFCSYSQGTALQAEAIAALPEGHSVHDAIFMETVDFQPQPFALLCARYGREAIKWAKYLTPQAIAQNTPDWMPSPGSDKSMLRRMLHDMHAFSDYPRGLARTRTLGALAEALASGKISPDTHLAFVNNSLSTISTTPANDAFAQKLAQVGFKNIDRITINNESHGMIDNPRAMTAFYALYREQFAPQDR